VKLLAESGAKVVLGDINKDDAEKLCKDHSSLTFVECDVSKYSDIYNLFRTAFDKHGRVDHAVSNAGIFGMFTADGESYYYILTIW
jgi:NAD(P)-dependent dehydrogenase (short-subunit alcohol dehydrogenase family)